MLSAVLMKTFKPILLSAGLILTAFSTACLDAQMVSPSIDSPDQPFSYFSRPTDEIGMMDAEAATEITPEGYLRTGYGEMMFFAGPKLEPTSVRIRTLEEGHLPIIHYEFESDGVAYRFTLFAATLDGKPEGTLVNFIRVTMKNQSSQSNRAILATGIRYDAPNTTGDWSGDNRFYRPARAIPRRLSSARRILQQPMGLLLRRQSLSSRWPPALYLSRRLFFPRLHAPRCL
jgi:hypothetical protein